MGELLSGKESFATEGCAWRFGFWKCIRRPGGTGSGVLATVKRWTNVSSSTCLPSKKPVSFALLPDFQAKHGSVTRVLELLVAESNGKWKLMSVLPDEKTEDAKRLSSLSDVASVARQITRRLPTRV